jgi:transcriptional regulator with XRE-family HTH domain
MPKRRPQQFLKRLGLRLRARRIEVDRPAAVVARLVEISVAQLNKYENGVGHAPAATLHRLAITLGTSSSALLGETMPEAANKSLDAMLKLYADVEIGTVMRHMEDMDRADRMLVKRFAARIARQPKPPETVEVMR